MAEAARARRRVVGNEIREVARHQVMQGLELMVRNLDFIQCHDKSWVHPTQSAMA